MKSIYPTLLLALFLTAASCSVAEEESGKPKAPTERNSNSVPAARAANTATPVNSALADIPRIGFAEIPPLF